MAELPDDNAYQLNLPSLMPDANVNTDQQAMDTIQSIQSALNRYFSNMQDTGDINADSPPVSPNLSPFQSSQQFNQASPMMDMHLSGGQSMRPVATLSQASDDEEADASFALMQQLEEISANSPLPDIVEANVDEKSDESKSAAIIEADESNDVKIDDGDNESDDEYSDDDDDEKKTNYTATTMQIVISLASNKPFILNVHHNNTIFDIKWKIQEKQGIPHKNQKLEFEGKSLQNGLSLNDYNIQSFSQLKLSTTTIHLSFILSDVRHLVSQSMYINSLGLYTMECLPAITISSILSILGLYNIKNSISMEIKTQNKDPIVINDVAKATRDSIFTIYDNPAIEIKLNLEKAPIEEKIDCIGRFVAGLEQLIEDKQSLFVNPGDTRMAQNRIFEITECKTFQDLEDRKKENDAELFTDIDKNIMEMTKEYEEQYVRINKIIVEVNKEMIKAKQEKETLVWNNLSTEIKKYEVKMFKLEVKVSDMKDKWNEDKQNVLKEIRKLLKRKTAEMYHKCELWTLDQVIEWLTFKNSNLKLSKDVIKKLEMIDMNGSKLHELSDSLLILAGMKDEKQRKMMIKCINDLFDEYGGHKYTKAQLCCICMMNEVNTCLVPCGHLCYCEECGRKSRDHSRNCPICRKRITKVITTYRAGLERK